MKILLENNKIIVEKNLEKSEIDTNFNILSQIYNDININKSFTGRNQSMLDLINIPFILITLLKQGNLELFIDYIKYVDSIPLNVEKKFKIIENVKSTVNIIKTISQKYFLNNLRLGRLNYDYLLINDIVSIPLLANLLKFRSEVDESCLIKINLILFSFELVKQDCGKNADYSNKIVENLIKNFEQKLSEAFKIVKEMKELSLGSKELLALDILDYLV